MNGIRGLSAVVVLAGHVFSWSQSDFAFGKVHAWQSLAVVVFFWLSGFLIVYNCLTKPGYTWADYVADRFSRIFTLYIPALLFTVAVVFLFAGKTVGAKSIAAHALMLQHTPFDRIFDLLPRVPTVIWNMPLWTVAVEWWLYMLFGVVYFWGDSGSRSRMAMLVLAAPAVLVCGYFLLKEYVAWTWVMGAVAAYVFVHTPRVKAGARILLLLGAAALYARFDVLALPSVTVNMYDLQLTIALALTLTAGTICVARIRFLADTSRFWEKLAFLSYSLYLFHEPIRLTIHHWLLQGAPSRPFTGLEAAGTVVLCLVLCSLVAWVAEDKHLSVRKALKRSAMVAWLKEVPAGERAPNRG